MKGVFASDNLYNRVMTGLFDALLVSVVTLLFCLPVITAGAALTAACAVYMKMAKDQEGPILRSYLREFRDNLTESFGGWIFMLLGGGLVILELYLSRDNGIFYGLSLSLAGLYAGYLQWYLCLRARFRESTASALINTGKFCLVYAPHCILCGLYTVVLIRVLLYFPMLMALLPLAAAAAFLYPPCMLIGRKMDAYIEERHRGKSDTDRH